MEINFNNNYVSIVNLTKDQLVVKFPENIRTKNITAQEINRNQDVLVVVDKITSQAYNLIKSAYFYRQVSRTRGTDASWVLTKKGEPYFDTESGKVITPVVHKNVRRAERKAPAFRGDVYLLDMSAKCSSIVKVDVALLDAYDEALTVVRAYNPMVTDSFVENQEARTQEFKNQVRIFNTLLANAPIEVKDMYLASHKDMDTFFEALKEVYKTDTYTAGDVVVIEKASVTMPSYGCKYELTGQDCFTHTDVRRKAVYEFTKADTLRQINEVLTDIVTGSVESNLVTSERELRDDIDLESEAIMNAKYYLSTAELTDLMCHPEKATEYLTVIKQRIGELEAPEVDLNPEWLA